ncbi:MAG: hypothetical protein EOO78_34210, partial [Oxalobacteraceae bacterium]
RIPSNDLPEGISRGIGWRWRGRAARRITCFAACNRPIRWPAIPAFRAKQAKPARPARPARAARPARLARPARPAKRIAHPDRCRARNLI